MKRADKYWAKKLEVGHTQHTQRFIDECLEALTHPPLIDPLYSSGLDSDEDPYESARDASTLSDPSPYDVTDLEEEYDNVMAYDTENSHQTTIANRNQQRRKEKQCHEC